MQAESWAERVVVDLLVARGAQQTSDFFVAWEETQNAAWANAQRDAKIKAASGEHLPHARGHLRKIYGEQAIGAAASAANVGCLPLVSVPPGGVFMTARVGRFALSGVTVRNPKFIAASLSYSIIMSANNVDIDPQQNLGLAPDAQRKAVTELAYFGCLVSIPCRSDPGTPQRLMVGNSGRRTNTLGTSHRIATPSTRSYKNRIEERAPSEKYAAAARIPDNAFSTFRLPKQDRRRGRRRFWSLTGIFTETCLEE